MARKGYRPGDKQVNVFVSLALHGQLRAAAGREQVSLQDFIVGVLREKVGSDDAGGRVESVGPDWDAILARGRESRVDVCGDHRVHEPVAAVDAGGLTGVWDPLEEIA